MAHVPIHVDDGDFSEPKQNGPAEYVFPFASRGDNISYIASVKMRCAAKHFVEPISMKQRVPSEPNLKGGTGYLVDFTDPSEVSQGSALLEWTEKYASVPQSRLEPSGNISYTQQIYYPSSGTIEEYSGTFPSNTLYEYSLTPLDIRFAPRVISIGGIIRILGGTLQDIIGTGPVLALDSENEIWMSKIYQRKSVIVTRLQPQLVA